MVTVQYSSQTKPLLTIADAIEANSIYEYPGEANILNVGDANGTFATSVATLVHGYYLYVAAISNSAHSISGDISCGTQYHFHMETQVMCK